MAYTRRCGAVHGPVLALLSELSRQPTPCRLEPCPPDVNGNEWGPAVYIKVASILLRSLSINLAQGGGVWKQIGSDGLEGLTTLRWQTPQLTARFKGICLSLLSRSTNRPEKRLRCTEAFPGICVWVVLKDRLRNVPQSSPEQQSRVMTAFLLSWYTPEEYYSGLCQHCMWIVWRQTIWSDGVEIA